MVGLMATSAVLLVTFEGREYDGGGVRLLVRDGDYIAAVDVFWSDSRMSGLWHTPNQWAAPDQVRLVSGSDVARILSGQPPANLYATFQAWQPGRPIGDLNFVVPEIRCSGPNGGCEDGDLPAIVFTKGDSWVGAPASALVATSSSSGPVPTLSMTRHEAWVQPALLFVVGIASLALVICITSLVVWRACAKEVPDAPAFASQGPAATESSLHLVNLARLYLGSMRRSLYIGAGLVVLLALATQIWGVTYLADELLEDHFPLGDVTEIWLELMTWWSIPVALAVAAVFWIGHVRDLRTEQRRWEAVSKRLSDLESQILR